MSANETIDPIIYQSAIELSYAAGKDCRELMLRNGMSEAEADEVVRKAFEWRYLLEPSLTYPEPDTVSSIVWNWIRFRFWYGI